MAALPVDGYLSISALTHCSARALKSLKGPQIVLHNNRPIAALVPYDEFMVWLRLLNGWAAQE